jgi:hypothetical protein
MLFDREQVKLNAAKLADKGVFIGTSSWKYEGWLGQLYTPSLYEYRGKVAKTRFDRGCLAEYAEVFKTVCVDAGITNSRSIGTSKNWWRKCRLISFSLSKSQIKSR